MIEILELEEKFVPETDDSRLRDDLTLIGHRKGGFVDLVYKLNWMIWKAFERFWSVYSLRMTLKAIGIEVIDLKTSYRENTRRVLEMFGWERPNYVYVDTIYHISGVISFIYGEHISLYQLLQDVSPALLLHHLRLEVRNGDFIFTLWL